MKDHNVSLAKLSSFITWMLVGGFILLLPGIIMVLVAMSSETPAGMWIIIGTSMAYLGAGAIGLGAVSAFWRQIAKVIVDGLGGNLYEYSGHDNSPRNFDNSLNRNDYFGEQNKSRSEAAGGSQGSALTSAEHLAHKAMGSPDLNAWGGSAGFSQWLKSLENPK